MLQRGLSQQFYSYTSILYFGRGIHITQEFEKEKVNEGKEVHEYKNKGIFLKQRESLNYETLATFER